MTVTTGPLVTVRHNEDAVEIRRMCSPEVLRSGIHVEAEIIYAPEQTQAAFAAVDRLAESLRKQIADGAERVSVDD